VSQSIHHAGPIKYNRGSRHEKEKYSVLYDEDTAVGPMTEKNGNNAVGFWVLVVFVWFSMSFHRKA
jgi:hypothetical protein